MHIRFFHIFSAVVLTAGVVLLNPPSTAFAGKCKSGCPTNSGGGSGGNSDTVSAWAEFTDPSGTLVGDGGGAEVKPGDYVSGAYVDGVDDVLVELADNTGFRLVPQKKSTRRVFIDLGLLDPTNGCGSPNGCIFAYQHYNNGTTTDNLSVECPIPSKERPGQTKDLGCSGYERVSVRLSDAVTSNSTTNILYMDQGNQYPGRYFDAELYMTTASGNTWEMVFKENAGIPGCNAENLGVTAFDDTGNMVTDHWVISTDTSDSPLYGTSDKFGCLVKEVHGGNIFVGFVDMTFTVTVHRL